MAWSFYNSSGKLIDGVLDSSITNAKMASDSIDSDQYVDGSIDLAHMSSQSVDEDNLYISNPGSNGEFLSKQSGNNGGLTWAVAGSQSFTGDTTITSGNLVIATAGKGIDFSAQASPASGMVSELLDHYEEGTWTPTIGDDTANGTSEGQAYTNQVGVYTRIGNTVFIQCYFYITDLGTMTTSQGANLVGLPFSSSNTTDLQTGFHVGLGRSLNISQFSSLSLRMTANQAAANIMVWDTTAGHTNLTVAELSAGAELTITGFYRV